MSNVIDLVRGWWRKGDSDLTAARLIAASNGPYDTACFHAQRAAENHLKGLLAFAGQPIPFTHNLEEFAHIWSQQTEPTRPLRSAPLITPYESTSPSAGRPISSQV
ncbi:MAG: HEPN domain-containing protein [Roseiflexus sp.]|nr:HEPN domain-containing protein [Roseiflexus sp.]MCS7289076.1 HEPN domain-containing protein [Roseiflexus sp.]MDW8148450.1 HEPN domain-containing protein [Roseiflexaceae bacterium]MDW8234098.1 HEPN domain-containing protein [Roseiflexaceae bacterium]